MTRGFPEACLCAVLAAAIGGSASAHVTLDSPNGNETLGCGDTFPVAWHVQIAHDHHAWHLEYSASGANGPWLPIAFDLPGGNTAVNSIHTYHWVVPDNLTTQARIRVTMVAVAGTWTDISDANFSIANLVAQDLGFGKPGANGQIPHLEACGNLAAGKTATLSLSATPPATPVVLALSTQLNPTPFLGGMLAPIPVLNTVALTTDAQGKFEVLVPGGLGPVSVVLQGIVLDPGASAGASLSNALRLTWP